MAQRPLFERVINGGKIMSFMNHEKKLCEILKVNSGSQLSYDSKTEEYVLTIEGHDGFRIPGDCEFCGDHIFKENSGKIICRVKRV